MGPIRLWHPYLVGQDWGRIALGVGLLLPWPVSRRQRSQLRLVSPVEKEVNYVSLVSPVEKEVNYALCLQLFNANNTGIAALGIFVCHINSKYSSKCCR